MIEEGDNGMNEDLGSLSFRGLSVGKTKRFLGQSARLF